MQSCLLSSDTCFDWNYECGVVSDHDIGLRGNRVRYVAEAYIDEIRSKRFRNEHYILVLVAFIAISNYKLF